MARQTTFQRFQPQVGRFRNIAPESAASPRRQGDGLNVLIRRVKTAPNDGLFIAQMAERAKDVTPAFRQAKKFIDNPENYTRPDRLRGDVAVERGGHVINWRPGYRPYHRASIRKFRNGGRFRITSTRPFHPILSFLGSSKLTQSVSRWIRLGLAQLRR